MFSRRKRLLFFFAVIVGFFLINIFLIAYYIELDSKFRKPNIDQENGPLERRMQVSFATKNFKIAELTISTTLNSSLSGKCQVSDSLSVSAYDRMTTPTCRNRMTLFLCSINSTIGWPLPRINNTCSALFDETRMHTYLGCFRDTSSNRIFKGFRYELKINNKAEICVQFCLRAGFSHAGVENSTQCFCDVSSDREEFRIDDDNCRKTKCPNSISDWCGGPNSLAIYLTGVIEVEPPIPVYQMPLHLSTSNSAENAIWSASASRPKILFLLQLNGRNSRQIRRLIKLIYRPDHLYYIHVDLRQEYMQYEMLVVERTLHTIGLRNFYVARDSQRFATIWGGTSLLNMFLNAVRNTLNGTLEKNWSTWDYILNLSETDMPLLSIDELEFLLMSNMGKSFLSSHGYNTAGFLQKQGFDYFFMECEKRMWRIGNRKNFPQNLRLDGGSDWVVVHRNLAAYAVDESNALTKQLGDFFTTVLLPLESFFHTLALNSEFCDRVLYRNLRLTNWRRKQGCRCTWLRRVVDWCGCSPLAIRHNDHRFDVQKCKSRLHFFARKFDSFIDADSIALAEMQVFRFYPSHLLSVWQSMENFNANWFNLFRANVDLAPLGSVSAEKSLFYNKWLESLLFYSFSSITGPCKIVGLDELFAFRIDTLTSFKLILRSNISCINLSDVLIKSDANVNMMHNHSESQYAIELLVKRNSRTFREEEKFALANEGKRKWTFSLNSIEYGRELDLKEDVLRDPSGLIETHDNLILLWRWRAKQLHSDEAENFLTLNVSKLPPNNTSPPVIVRLWAPSSSDQHDELVSTKKVPSYDSINYAQHCELDLNSLLRRRPNVVSGIWSAEILSEFGVILGQIQFPIYATKMQAMLDVSALEKLSAHFFSVEDVCIDFEDENSTDMTKNIIENAVAQNTISSAIKSCKWHALWSSKSPDPKADIRHGFDNSLGILV